VAFFDRLGTVGKWGLGAPILLIAMLSMMVLPLPPIALDVLFTFNIALSLVVIMVAVYSRARSSSRCSRRCCWSPHCCGWR